MANVRRDLLPVVFPVVAVPVWALAVSPVAVPVVDAQWRSKHPMEAPKLPEIKLQ